MEKTRIILLDDEPLILALIQELIAEEADLELARAVMNKDEFLNLVRTERFDAGVLDISIGEREGGIDILRTLREQGIALPCLISSAHHEIDYAPRCLQAGAKGYINKGSIVTDLAHGIREVMAGKLFISGAQGPFLLEQYRKASIGR